MNILCTICARGGSKGVPQKNVRPLAGRPLLHHTLEQAHAARIFDKIVISSDSEEIFECAGDQVDLKIKRPPELATDQAAKIPVLQHALNMAEKHFGRTFDILVDLDVTAPLRLPEDIIHSVQLLVDSQADNVLTVTPARKTPYFNQTELDQNGHAVLPKKPDRPFVRRQDVPSCYDLNASIYPWKREALLQAESVFQAKTKIFVMPPERSLDIDSPLDFAIVEFILMNNFHKKPADMITPHQKR